MLSTHIITAFIAVKEPLLHQDGSHPTGHRPLFHSKGRVTLHVKRRCVNTEDVCNNAIFSFQCTINIPLKLATETPVKISSHPLKR